MPYYLPHCQISKILRSASWEARRFPHPSEKGQRAKKGDTPSWLPCLSEEVPRHTSKMSEQRRCFTLKWLAHNYHEMNVRDVIPHLNKTAFPSSCFQAERNKDTVYTKDGVKVNFKVPQISTNSLILWIKWHLIYTFTYMYV